MLVVTPDTSGPGRMGSGHGIRTWDQDMGSGHGVKGGGVHTAALEKNRAHLIIQIQSFLDGSVE